MGDHFGHPQVAQVEAHNSRYVDNPPGTNRAPGRGRSTPSPPASAPGKVMDPRAPEMCHVGRSGGGGGTGPIVLPAVFTGLFFILSVAPLPPRGSGGGTGLPFSSQNQLFWAGPDPWGQFDSIFNVGLLHFCARSRGCGGLLACTTTTEHTQRLHLGF